MKIFHFIPSKRIYRSTDVLLLLHKFTSFFLFTFALIDATFCQAQPQLQLNSTPVGAEFSLILKLSNHPTQPPAGIVDFSNV